MEKSETISKWDEVANKYFGWWDRCIELMMVKAKKKKMTSSVKTWKNNNNKFLGELRTSGRTAMTWIQKSNLEIYALQFDMDMFPGKRKGPMIQVVMKVWTL